MSKETFVFVAGIILTVVSFLGIPKEWRQYTIFGIGVLLVFVGYALRRREYLRRLERGNGERGTDSYVETTEPLFDEGALQ